MEERIAKCTIAYNGQNITISGLDENVVLDCSADINITSLVEKLVIVLDTVDKIECDYQGFDDADKKHGIIKKAVSGAFEAFNEVSAPTQPSVEDLPIF